LTSKSPFTARAWCVAYFAMVIATLALVAGANYALDFYGLFADTADRPIRLYANERTGKYLLSLRYIPANFQGIIIGPSVSQNWDVRRVGSIHIYNASVDGANISEEKLIADNAFARGRMRLAVFCIHPYLTMNHGRKTDYMSPREYWGALGSIQLLRDYTGAVLAHLLGTPAFADGNGVGSSEAEADDAEAAARWQRAMRHAQAPPPDLTVDEQAVSEYALLVRSARAHGAVVVGFIPPIYAVGYRSQGEAYQNYFSRMRKLFAPDETIIDFNAPQYTSYTADAATFYDGTHLSRRGAGFFSRELTRLLQEELDRRLPEVGHATAHASTGP
jgi:hypothetical protein